MVDFCPFYFPCNPNLLNSKQNLFGHSKLEFGAPACRQAAIWDLEFVILDFRRHALCAILFFK